MIYEYPCLYDYMKDETALISSVENIFRKIASISGVLFANYDAEQFAELGYSYYYERYKRPLKVLYFHVIKAVDFTDANAVKALFERIGKAAYTRFGSNWEKLYNAYFVASYNPLENYDMTQTRTPLLDTTDTQTRKQETKTETNASTSVVPFNESEVTLTSETQGDTTTTEDKTKNEIENVRQERGTDTLTRHGNIGVLTSQAMLQSELDLRKLDFQKRIFADIDKILLRDYYGGECWPL